MSKVLTISFIKDTSQVILWDKNLKQLVYDYNLKKDQDLIFELSKTYQTLKFEEVKDVNEIIKRLK